MGALVGLGVAALVGGPGLDGVVPIRDMVLIGPNCDRPSSSQNPRRNGLPNVVASTSTSHFVPDTYPYEPDTTIRTGNPCSAGSASPFLPMGSSAPRWGSITTDVGVPVFQPSVLVLNS